MLAAFINLLKYAPSGGNLQPWALKIARHGSSVSIAIYLDPNLHFEKQHTDHCGFGALISLGILAYSVEYLCPDFGFELMSKSFNSEKDLHRNFILITLKERAPLPSQRPEMFRNRFTDRRAYQTMPLGNELNQNLQEKFGSALVVFGETEKRKSIVKIFRRLSLIRFQNQTLSSELSHELKNDFRESTGIPIMNLGLSPALRFVTRLQKKFPVHIPFDSAYSWPLRESVSTPMFAAGALACLKTKGCTPQNWMELGEKFMALWLTVEEHCGRLQPFGNTLTIANYFQEPAFFKFTEKHKKFILESHSELLNDFGIDTKDACIFFRIGYSNLERQETPRKNIHTIF